MISLRFMFNDDKRSFKLILPRQARDKRNENSKSSLFVGGISGCLHGREPYLDEGRSMWQMWCWTKEALAAPADPGKKTTFAPFLY
jgi:hypothetical protein